MNRNNSKVFPQPFRGSIDDLLLRVATADLDAVELEVENEKVVVQVMRDFKVDREQAVAMLEQAQLAMVQQTIDDLMAKGLVEVIDYDADGEARYGLTEKGIRLKTKLT